MCLLKVNFSGRLVLCCTLQSFVKRIAKLCAVKIYDGRRIRNAFPDFCVPCRKRGKAGPRRGARYIGEYGTSVSTDRFFAAFFGADADRVFDRTDEYLAVADFLGLRG